MACAPRACSTRQVRFFDASVALVFSLLFSAPFLAAWQAVPAWPEIRPDELQLKDNPAQPGAAAMILERQVESDDNTGTGRHYYRIKIFKQEGRRHADVLVVYDKDTRIEDIRGRTILRDGSVLEFRGPVYDTVAFRTKKLKVYAKTFALPGAEVGSIIEYSYATRSSEGLPDYLSDLLTEAKTSFTYPTARWVIDQPLFTQRARFRFNPLVRSRIDWASVGLRENQSPQRGADQVFELEVQNIPAIEEENFMPPRIFLETRVDFYYWVGLRNPGERYWVDLAKLKAGQLEQFLDRKKELQRALSEIVSPADGPEEKLKKIYARVQRLRYVSYEIGTNPKELDQNKNVADVMKRGYAFANEANYLFLGLARAAGLDAAAVMVASRETGYFLASIPNWRQLNATVVRVRLGSRMLYFDPATRYCPYGLLPWEETDAGGVVLNTLGGEIVTTPLPQSADAVIERKAVLELAGDGTATGSITVSFSGQEALTRRLAADETDEQGKRKQLEDELRGWLPRGAELEQLRAANWENGAEPLVVESRIRLPHLADAAGSRLLFTPAVFQAGARSPFEATERRHPVYFRHPYQTVDEVTIKLPAGYAVEGLPPERKESTAFADYLSTSTAGNGAVKLSRRLSINGVLIGRGDYGALRMFFHWGRAADEGRVVLRTAAQQRSGS